MVLSKGMTLAVGGKSATVTLYSGADDPDLPDNIKALPTQIRARWVNNYNWCIMDCQDDEDAQDMADSSTSMSVDDITEMMGGDKAVTAAVTATPAPNTTRTGDGVLRASSMPTPPATPTPDRTWFKKFKAWLMEPDEVDKAVRASMTPTATEASTLRPITLYKGGDGAMHALLVYSNQFKDREGEIFSEASHMEYATAAEAGEAGYPDFHLWHGGPATKWGTGETVSYVNGFSVVGGAVDKGKEGVALALKEMSDRGELAVSFGYVGLLGPDSVYALYRPFEISPLPVGVEANPWWTAPLDFKENNMGFSDKKKEWLKTHFGMKDTDIVMAETEFQKMSDALKAANVGYREASAAVPTPPAPAAPAVVAPPAAPAAPAAGAAAAATESGDDAGVMPQLTAMATAIKEMASIVGGLATEVKGLKEAAPAAAAAAADANTLARIAAGPGFSPTKDPANVVAGAKETAENEHDWLDKVFKGTGLEAFGQPSNGAVVGALPGSLGGSMGEVK